MISSIKQIHLKDIATFSNLFLSFYSVILLFQNQFRLACIALFFNIMVLDIVDGIIARLTKKSNEFGKHLDTLTDFYGSSMIIPFFIYSAYQKNHFYLAVLTAFIPLIAGILREISQRTKPVTKTTYFIGLPRNTAALYIIIYMSSSLFQKDWGQWLGIAVVVAISYLQLSYWPYIGNDKQTLKFPLRLKVYFVYSAIMLLVSLFVGGFWDISLILLTAYIISPLIIVDKSTRLEIRNKFYNRAHE